MKRIFIYLFVILSTVIGFGIGDYCSSIESLKWLAIGGEIGFKEPMVLDLSFLQLSFGIWCRVNIAGILCLILSAFFAKRIFKWIKV